METSARQGHLDVSVDRIILNWVLQKYDRGRGMDLYGSGEGEVAGFVHTIMNFRLYGTREISLY
jgi:hypothetical protein